MAPVESFRKRTRVQLFPPSVVLKIPRAGLGAQFTFAGFVPQTFVARVVPRVLLHHERPRFCAAIDGELRLIRAGQHRRPVRRGPPEHHPGEADDRFGLQIPREALQSGCDRRGLRTSAPASAATFFFGLAGRRGTIGLFFFRSSGLP